MSTALNPQHKLSRHAAMTPGIRVRALAAIMADPEHPTS